MEHRGNDIDESAVRTKAYELWLERGCPQDSPEQDWYQAERLLRTAPRPALLQQLVAEPDDATPTPRIGRRPR
jgi:hypothetical protein